MVKFQVCKTSSSVFESENDRIEQAGHSRSESNRQNEGGLALV